MKSSEHRAVGEAAAGGALVPLGADTAEERLVLSYGDVVALSGDFFVSHPCGTHDVGTHGVDDTQTGPEGLVSDDLFGLADLPGQQGTKPGTRDEIICALKVMTVDGAYVDPRFEPGGQFGHYHFTPTAAATEVERRVRDRFLVLALANGDHFVTPGQPRTASARSGPPSSRFDSATIAYRRLHQVALDEACQLGCCRGDVSQAMAREAAAQHYLTDAFAAGHLRTPVTAIRHFWHHRYPRFWQRLQHKVAADTACALRELVPPARLLPRRFLDEHTLAAVQARTRNYPLITFGDLLARVFHDWDNTHGLSLQGGGTLFGDGLLDEGTGKDLAIAAARCGIDDVEVAYQLGASGKPLCGEDLYRAVRFATAAPHDAFRPETQIPIPSPDNPPQNWQATSLEELWSSPIVGTTGTTVGTAVEETLRLGTEVTRRLDCLGPGVFELPSLQRWPAVQRWAVHKACQAYHHGFLHNLTHNPKTTMLTIVHNSNDVSGLIVDG